ncbi:hypothetical protein D3C80_1325980 [compost metagenome]
MRLATRTFEKHHQLPRDFEGHGAPQVFFDHGQRQVDAGGHPGRGPDRAVVDEDRVGLDVQLRMLLRQLLATGPVGDHAPAVEPAAGRQQERTGAYRGNPPAATGMFAHPGDQRRILRRCVNTPATGDDQGISALIRQRFGQQRQPRRRHHRPAATGNHGRCVGWRQALLAGYVVGRSENLQRPGDVEQLHVGESEYMDGFRHLA